MSDQNNLKPLNDGGDEVSELKNIIEAAIFAASEPLTVRKMIALFPNDAQPTADEVKDVLSKIEEEYAERGVELKKLGKGWRFRSKEKYSTWLRRLTINNPPRFSRALLETLSIIAYRQPVTRGDIEEIRGVAVSTDIIRTIEDRGWIAEIGHRDVPGRPALFGTTSEFLEYFSLSSLRDLPELMQPRELIEVAKEMNLSLPEVANEENAEDQAPDDNEADEAELNDNEFLEIDTQSIDAMNKSIATNLESGDVSEVADVDRIPDSDASSAESAEHSVDADHRAQGERSEDLANDNVIPLRPTDETPSE